MQKNVKDNSNTILPEGGLLQSDQWASVLRAEGKKIVVIDGINGVECDLPVVGSYIYFPRAYDISRFDIDHIVKSKYAWARIDVSDQKMLDALKKSDKKIVPSPHNMQPQYNLIMDISSCTEEDLLAQMKSKTRYNIRLAQKKGVEILVSKEQKFIDAFISLVQETADRKDVNFHTKEHYENILRVLPDNMVELYVAIYDEKIIAANLISFYNKTATYLHGATSNEHRNVMAPYLLQWHSIINARKKGFSWYDLGGVFPDSCDPGKKGITRFKTGFAPEKEIFSTQGSHDIILSPVRYGLYVILQRARSVIHF
jgi:lipid II:glycine glycyltransferase (peptidoglycan interpeptide bridge formation enzyme)